LRVDPDFPQAHAYLGFYEAWSFGSDASDVKGIKDEIARAEKLAPGLPEARLAEAAYDIWTAGKPEAALKAMEGMHEPLANNADAYNVRGYALRRSGRSKEAVAEFLQAVRLDPYSGLPIVNAALMDFGLRDYEDADNLLSSVQERWPNWVNPHIWRAQVEFAYHGDVQALSSVIDSDLRPYENDPDDSALVGMRLEVAHLKGRHAVVIADLKTYPESCLETAGFGGIMLRTLCVDTFTAESQRLLGRDKDAKQTVALHIQELSREVGEHPDDSAMAVHLALLQAFGGNSAAALKALKPELDRLEGPAEGWPEDDAELSIDAAIVLAWSGERQQAVQLLTRSMQAAYGAHAAILAHDPVWRPLYKEPAFVALLAAHGQTLSYAR
jgi:tetratricopeptide (TPR) repeat protein